MIGRLFGGGEAAADRKAQKERKAILRRAKAVTAADRAGHATHKAAEQRRFGGR